MSDLSRKDRIVRTSWLGIVANVLLAGFKALVGFLANSIAVVLDAVNNLSDALSSVITLVSAKLANRPPDKEHPMGHGRIEYISAITIAFVILFAGAASLEASIKKVIHPEPPEYTALTLIVVSVAIGVKIWLAWYFKKTGKELNSEALVASGVDAGDDVIVSVATLISAFMMMVFNVNIEGWIGIVISIFILKAGIDIIKKPLNELLGLRPSAELSKAIKADAMTVDGVMGAYDLLLHNFGPDQPTVGSMRVEVSDRLSATEIQRICNNVQRVIAERHNVFLNIGFYAVNTTDPEAVAIREALEKEVAQWPQILQVHGMYVDPQTHAIQFDVVISFEADSPEDLCRNLSQKVETLYPDYSVLINIDRDLSD